MMRSLSYLIALALTVTGCGYQGTNGAPMSDVKVMDYQAMLVEYHRLADKYPWPLPEGITFPETLATPAEPTVYQIGEGANQADSFWICAWMGEWISADAERDAVQAGHAWSWVDRADETQLHRLHYDDPRDVWHREILAPAQTGNPQAFEEFYSTSCGFPGLDTLQQHRAG